MTCRRTLAFAVLAILVIHGGRASIAWADTPASSVKEAGKRFQRGVALYNEADYRAALVEFRRAFEIAPNAAVLYNIGQTYYQLQNYAAALTTLERYLTESGPAAAHRAEVEATLETLQARVGKVAITTSVPDCEITVDDELQGKSPFSEPILVSIGRRKITAMHEGRPPETRFVDVAAGDTVQVQFALNDPNSGAQPPGGSATPARRNWVTTSWVVTGVAGAAALGFGGAAFLASRSLNSARDSYDPDPTHDQARRDDLSKKSSRLKTLSLIADIAGAATVVAAGVSLTLMLSRSDSHEVHIAVVPNGIQLAGAFP